MWKWASGVAFSRIPTRVPLSQSFLSSLPHRFILRSPSKFPVEELEVESRPNSVIVQALQILSTTTKDVSLPPPPSPPLFPVERSCTSTTSLFPPLLDAQQPDNSLYVAAQRFHWQADDFLPSRGYLVLLPSSVFLSHEPSATSSTLELASHLPFPALPPSFPPTQTVAE
ncbi:hypothetical protein NMY22_g7339 [Coprinellus aureogranulatus]|nr:hypothetical protein NMY22_g7339 [Coprinellus aureogranulatus]